MHCASRALFMTAVAALFLVNSTAFARAAEPYQAQSGIADSATCPNMQCYFTFPMIPAGKRLQLTSVSAQLGRVSNTIVLEGGGVAYFVTKSHPDLGTLTTPVSLFYGPGTTPSARVFAPDTSLHTSLVVTIVGELSAA